MNFDDTPEEAAFRATARAWLDANAPKDLEADLKKSGFASMNVGGRDPIQVSKAWQKKKQEAGWACLQLVDFSVVQLGRRAETERLLAREPALGPGVRDLVRGAMLRRAGDLERARPLLERAARTLGVAARIELAALAAAGGHEAELGALLAAALRRVRATRDPWGLAAVRSRQAMQAIYVFADGDTAQVALAVSADGRTLTSSQEITGMRIDSDATRVDDRTAP